MTACLIHDAGILWFAGQSLGFLCVKEQGIARSEYEHDEFRIETEHGEQLFMFTVTGYHIEACCRYSRYCPHRDTVDGQLLVMAPEYPAGLEGKNLKVSISTSIDYDAAHCHWYSSLHCRFHSVSVHGAARWAEKA